MPIRPRVKFILTLAIGVTGAAVAFYAGLPAGALIGSAVAVSLASLYNLTTTIPVGFRAIAFSIIGSSLGSSLTRDFVSQAIHWPVSLLVLTVCVFTIMISCSFVLIKMFNQSAETAILATSPGALGYTIAIALDGIGDVRSIIVMQSVRLLLIITCLPFVLEYFWGGSADVAAGATAATMPFGAFILIFSITLFLGRVLERFKVPASYLLVGTFVSGVAHVMGLVDGRPTSVILFIGFSITGTVVGARFSTISRGELKRLLKASMVVVCLATSIAALFAALAASLLSMSYGQVFVAFAPGGVEAMAAMALALHYDPAFVAVHHIYRIILLILTLPLFLKILSKLGNSNG